MALAWRGLKYDLEIRSEPRNPDIKSPRGDRIHTGLRCPRQLLNQTPVDLLGVETNPQVQPPKMTAISHWYRMVQTTATSLQPKLIIESWPPRTATWEHGPSGKGMRVLWDQINYTTRILRLDAQEVGGAIVQPRLIVLRVSKRHIKEWQWSPIKATEQSRPMSNLLTPPGLLRLKPHQYKTSVAGFVADSASHSMPGKPGSWIRTEQGIRRLTVEEVGRGLGIPKSWTIPISLLTHQRLEATTSLFHWEYITQCLVDSLNITSAAPSTEEEERFFILDVKSKSSHQAKSTDIAWHPPDLAEGHRWYQDRVNTLTLCAQDLPNPSQVVADGIDDLQRHRTNYDQYGATPTTLQLLWWEFPPEHWQDIREGSSMNFLRIPEPGLKPNGVLGGDQLQIAGEFVDE